MIMASRRLGAITWSKRSGEPSTTIATPLSLSFAMRSSLTVEVTMVLPARSSRSKSSRSCTGATTTVAPWIALRSRKRVHSFTGSDDITPGSVQSSTRWAPAV